MTNGLHNLGPAVAGGSAGGGLVLADFLRLVGSGLILLAMLWVALLWLRRRTWFNRVLQERMRLRVLETRPLAHRSALHLVSCSGQEFLVAVSPAGVSLVATLNPPATGPTTAPAADFASIIREKVANPEGPRP